MANMLSGLSWHQLASHLLSGCLSSSHMKTMPHGHHHSVIRADLRISMQHVSCSAALPLSIKHLHLHHPIHLLSWHTWTLSTWGNGCLGNIRHKCSTFSQNLGSFGSQHDPSVSASPSLVCQRLWPFSLCTAFLLSIFYIAQLLWQICLVILMALSLILERRRRRI